MSVLSRFVAVLLLSVMGVLFIQNQQAHAVVVEGSQANAYTFGDQFCANFGAGGVGPSGVGVGDLIWITATDGSRNIVANQGDPYVNVTVHAAGKYCSAYGNRGAASGSYFSDWGGVSGSIGYGPGASNRYFHTTTSAQLSLAGLGVGVTNRRINMSVVTFFPGALAFPVSPSAWTDLTITIKGSWSLTLADAHISEVDPVTRAVIRNYGQNTDVAGTPGKAYMFNYRWVNSGTGATDVTTYMQREYNYPSTGYVNNDPFFTKPSGVSGGGGWMYNGSPGWMTIIPSDGGKSYCMRTGVYPRSSSNSGKNATNYLCVNVSSRFVLYPSLVMPTTSALPGQNISNIVGTITNSIGGGGSTNSQPDTTWQLSQFIVKPGGTIPPSSGGYELPRPAPCTYFGAGGNVCTNVRSGTDMYPPGAKTYPPESITVPNDIEPGSQVCFVMSVNKYDGGRGSGDWLHSAVRCLKIAKKPKIQVWGGDVRTRGGIVTSLNTIDAAQYGSWVEYGAFSTGTNTNFGSGSSFSGGSANTVSVAQRHQLTFANRGGSYGRYTVPTTPELVNQFLSVAPQSAMAGSNLSSYASGTYQRNGAITISASAIGQAAGIGKSIVIISTGTVTITGDITYTGPGPGNSYTSITQLPQVVIIARTINVQGGVGEINAWLLTTAGGVINTCSDVAATANLSSAICDKPLVVNGTISTDTLYLRRTAGSDNAASATVPAETFNLRADAYLWGYGNTSQNGRVQTDRVIEAAPRF